jgi:hypothetical protein
VAQASIGLIQRNPLPSHKPFKGECIFQVVAVTLQLKGGKLSIVIKEEKSFTEKSS